MPEVSFRIRWPDGAEENCYSPSTIIRAHLSARGKYTVSEFLRRSQAGLDDASRRVQAQIGRRCAWADAQSARIAATAARHDPEEIVLCLSMT